MHFKRNLGAHDSVMRIIVGVSVLSAYFLKAGGSYNSWFVLGLVPLITGIIDRCPIYTLFGICTYVDKDHSDNLNDD